MPLLFHAVSALRLFYSSPGISRLCKKGKIIEQGMLSASPPFRRCWSRHPDEEARKRCPDVSPTKLTSTPFPGKSSGIRRNSGGWRGNISRMGRDP
jgi:hypothetical protein